MAYDSWGKRRTLNGAPVNGTPTPDNLDGVTDNKGYTGHEMLDQLDLVHMNGRIYDPLVARMMSADPYIQDPLSSQSYNRYTYVWNNPTNLTDPTGFNASDEKNTPANAEGQSEKKPKTEKSSVIVIVTPVTSCPSGNICISDTKGQMYAYVGYINTGGENSGGGNTKDNTGGKGATKSGVTAFLDKLDKQLAQTRDNLLDAVPFIGPQLKNDFGGDSIKFLDPLQTISDATRAGQKGEYGESAILAISLALRPLKAVGPEITSLYRAVGPEEFSQLMKTGKLAFGPNGSTMKQFGFKLDEVLKYANWDTQYAAIVRIDVRTSTLKNLHVSFGQIDANIFKSGVVTAEGQKALDAMNKAIISIKHAF